jgi:hypothetical protein
VADGVTDGREPLAFLLRWRTLDTEYECPESVVVVGHGHEHVVLVLRRRLDRNAVRAVPLDEALRARGGGVRRHVDRVLVGEEGALEPDLDGDVTHPVLEVVDVLGVAYRVRDRT